jgi:hypothetical protein
MERIYRDWKLYTDEHGQWMAEQFQTGQKLGPFPDVQAAEDAVVIAEEQGSEEEEE